MVAEWLSLPQLANLSNPQPLRIESKRNGRNAKPFQALPQGVVSTSLTKSLRVTVLLSLAGEAHRAPGMGQIDDLHVRFMEVYRGAGIGGRG